MSTVNITEPASDSVPFPADKIRGTYKLFAIKMTPPLPEAMPGDPPPQLGLAVAPNIVVTVTRESDNTVVGGIGLVTVTIPDGMLSGTWEVNRPAGLVAGVAYRIDAELTHASYPSDTDRKEHITA